MERKCRKTFDSQNEAILHSQTNCDFLVFSYEINYGGCRRFMSSSALEFWSFYKDMEESKRFHYEVIVKLKPCKLYFDIEYVLTYNPLINGHQMTIDFIDFVNSKLKELFCKDISKEDVVILESSSALKFSIHLIFSKVIFSNNNQMGQFVEKIHVAFFTEGKERNEENALSVKRCYKSAHVARVETSLVEYRNCL